jgi:hypothetical protein
MDLKGSGHALLYYSIPTFAWRNREKQKRVSTQCVVEPKKHWQTSVANDIYEDGCFLGR